MPCWPRPNRPPPLRDRALAALVFCVFVTLQLSADRATAQDAGFDMERVDMRAVNGVYLLDAFIDFDFSKESLEALHSGVPLTVVLEMEVRRERAILDATVAQVEARYALEVHPLSGQYLVRNAATGVIASFPAYQDAVGQLGLIDGFPLIDQSLLEPGETYYLRMRARLDIEALPSPMRLVAYLNSLWRLSSDWHAWPLPR